MPLRIFYCYAREDYTLRNILEKHLATLKRQDLITDWHDRNINAGREWAKEINTNLNEADIILLLISPDFMHSDYCYGVEMKRALERHENGTVRVIPIFLRHVDYQGAPFSNLQALPTDAIPVTDRKWRSRDEAFFNVVQGIRKVVGELFSNQLVTEGNTRHYRQQYKEALDTFERAIHFNQDNELAYIGKGQTLIRLAMQEGGPSDDKFEEASTVFTRAIKLNSTNVDAYIGKSEALYRAYSTSWNTIDPRSYKINILKTLEQALTLDPNNEAVYRWQGHTFMALKYYQQALTAYQNAIKVAAFPDWSLYKNLGEAFHCLSRYEEALGYYELASKEYTKDASLYEIMGEVLFKLKKYERALNAFDAALSIKITSEIISAKIHKTRGDIFLLLGKHQNALDAFEQALQLYPGFYKLEKAQVHRGKASIWRELAQLEDKKADKLDPPKPSIKTLVASSDHDDILRDLDTHPF